MKKNRISLSNTISILLLALMLLIPFTGCGGSQDTTDTVSRDDETSTPAPPKQAASSEEAEYIFGSDVLKGVRSVAVLIEDLPQDAADMGLSRNILLSDMEEQLNLSLIHI